LFFAYLQFFVASCKKQPMNETTNSANRINPTSPSSSTTNSAAFNEIPGITYYLDGQLSNYGAIATDDDNMILYYNPSSNVNEVYGFSNESNFYAYLHTVPEGQLIINHNELMKKEHSYAEDMGYIAYSESHNSEIPQEFLTYLENKYAVGAKACNAFLFDGSSGSGTSYLQNAIPVVNLSSFSNRAESVRGLTAGVESYCDYSYWGGKKVVVAAAPGFKLEFSWFSFNNRTSSFL
jgi:hypothetical protein